MSCYQSSIGSVPGLNEWNGLEPVCKYPLNHKFKQITCPLKTLTRSSKLCSLLPPGVFNSLTDFLVNLPIVLLFLVSTPARVIYCVAYFFLINFDSLLDAFRLSVVNTAIDFMTNPLVYFAIGLTEGESLSPFNAPYLVGILDHACIPNILKPYYQGIGTIFYFIGYGLGFILGLITDLYDIILYAICSVVTFSLSFSLCLSYDIVDVFKGGAGVVLTIYPFSFLADFLKNYINCGCVLGGYPSAYLGFCLNFGGSCPSSCPCGIGFTPPVCSPLPNLPPPKAISETFAINVPIDNLAKTIISDLEQGLSDLSNYAHDAISDLQGGLNTLSEYTQGAISDLHNALSDVSNALTGAYNDLSDAFSGFVSSAQSTFSEIESEISELESEVSNSGSNSSNGGSGGNSGNNN